MSDIMPEPTPIAIALVEHAHAYLIGKRAGGPLAGYWEFPGGKCRAGERPDQCAIRECREEAGLDVRAVRLRHRVEHAYPHGIVALHFYDCVPADPSARPLGTYRWVPAAELARYRFPDANASILAELTGIARSEVPSR